MHSPFPTAPTAQSRSAGFSLPEVAMAIGIIAIAFVALIGLLPVGLNTYRAAIDEANQTWIMQSMNSMVQTTDFAQIEELDYKASNEIYYFDEEGALIDRATTSNGDISIVTRRIYAVKLLVSDLDRPGTTDKMEHGWRVLVVMAPYTNALAMKDFNNLGTVTDLEALPQNTQLRTRSIVVARLDAQLRNS
jgi:uncharacterized protein (TIGR02598 family)